MDHQLFMVELANVHVITWAHNREDAKRRCKSWIGSNPDYYIVSPLTEKGDRVHLNITLFV